MRGVEIEGKRIVLTNLAGDVYALDSTCTHEEFDLSSGFMVEERIVCPLHLSQFDVRTGEVYNPPATVPLKTYNVKIEGSDIFVEL